MGERYRGLQYWKDRIAELDAENKVRSEVLDEAQCEINDWKDTVAGLQAENKALREAARAAVDAVRFQKPEHERAAIDALAALIGEE